MSGRLAHEDQWGIQVSDYAQRPVLIFLSYRREAARTLSGPREGSMNGYARGTARTTFSVIWMRFRRVRDSASTSNNES